MYTKLFLVALVAVATAAPQGSYSAPPRYTSDEIPILSDNREGPDQHGNYNFNFETGDGISRTEEGAPQGEEGAVASQGYWTFSFPDGSDAHVEFIADGDGYQPESDLLPVGPPIPEHSLIQIEKARLEDSKGVKTSYTSP
ncbi:cuticle protein AM1159-like [Panulirus ornatus]|uniref:cuticle protein AM1159-like n=1 Tax=Panulirus ornatus TaxID=150431 RepID=UPI003A843C38